MFHQEYKMKLLISIMVDKVTSHNTEVMPLCIRFVDNDKHIREEFVQFSTLVRVTKVIATQICSGINKDSLRTTYLLGKTCQQFN